MATENILITILKIIMIYMILCHGESTPPSNKYWQKAEDIVSRRVFDWILRCGINRFLNCGVEGKRETTTLSFLIWSFMNMDNNNKVVLDNGLPRCNMPWRSESGRVRSKADSVVIQRNPCKVGTWNVRTMLEPGKLEEVKMEMDRLKIDILGLAEVRWGGSGDFWSDEYRVIYTGEKQGSNGTAIILNKKWGLNIENTIHLSDRLTAVKIKAKPFDITLLQVYMPTSGHPDEEIEEIYDSIDSILDTVKDTDSLIIMGDFNAVGEGKEELSRKFWVGKEK